MWTLTLNPAPGVPGDASSNTQGGVKTNAGLRVLWVQNRWVTGRNFAPSCRNEWALRAQRQLPLAAAAVETPPDPLPWHAMLLSDLAVTSVHEASVVNMAHAHSRCVQRQSARASSWSSCRSRWSCHSSCSSTLPQSVLDQSFGWALTTLRRMALQYRAVGARHINRQRRMTCEVGNAGQRAKHGTECLQTQPVDIVQRSRAHIAAALAVPAASRS